MRSPDKRFTKSQTEWKGARTSAQNADTRMLKHYHHSNRTHTATASVETYAKCDQAKKRAVSAMLSHCSQ